MRQVTGFTQTFLRPRLFEDLRLDVELASVSSDEVDDLASGFGRFHVFLLRKCDRAPGAPANSLRGAILGPEDGLPADLPDLEPAAGADSYGAACPPRRCPSRTGAPATTTPPTTATTRSRGNELVFYSSKL